jgi:hypothetical protein
LGEACNHATVAVQPGFLEQYRVAEAQRPPPKPHLFVVLGPWLIAIAVLTGFWVYDQFVQYEPRLPPSQAGALVWGNAIFANKRDFSGWLRQHESSYAAWRKLHPAGAKFLAPHKHRIKPHGTKVTRTHVTKARPAHKPHGTKAAKTHAAKARPAPKVTPSKTRNAAPSRIQSAGEARSRTSWILLAVLGLLVAFASASVIRARRAQPLRPALPAARDLLHADVLARTAAVARITEIRRDITEIRHDPGAYRRVRTLCRRALVYLAVAGAAVAIGVLAGRL